MTENNYSNWQRKGNIVYNTDVDGLMIHKAKMRANSKRDEDVGILKHQVLELQNGMQALNTKLDRILSAIGTK